MVASAPEPRPLVRDVLLRDGQTLRLQATTPVDYEDIKASCFIAGARISLPSASALQRAASAPRRSLRASPPNPAPRIPPNPRNRGRALPSTRCASRERSRSAMRCADRAWLSAAWSRLLLLATARFRADGRSTPALTRCGGPRADKVDVLESAGARR